MSSTPFQFTCFSGILCGWVYIAERRIVELKKQFSDKVSIKARSISSFGDPETRFNGGWKDPGGFERYADHVRMKFLPVTRGRLPYQEVCRTSRKMLLRIDKKNHIIFTSDGVGTSGIGSWKRFYSRPDGNPLFG